jgi:parallel beta-helix repeat protein
VVVPFYCSGTRLLVDVLVLSVLVLQAMPAGAATYYVSRSGYDGRSCTDTQSASTPKLTLRSAVTCLKPGDTLLVKSGTYPEALINNVPSGTSWTSKVRIAAAPGETVWLKPTSGGWVVNLWSTQQYIEFDRINMDASYVQSGLIKIEGGSGYNVHHIRVKNAELMGAPGQGILLTALAPGVIGGNEFINLRIHRVGQTDYHHAFYIQSSNNLIDACDIYDFVGGGVHIYNGYGQSISNTTIRNTIIRDGRSVGGMRGWGVIVANGSTGTKIYNNLIYNIRNTSATSGGIYVYRGSNTQIYNNTVYGNADFGIYLEAGTSGTLLRNNISYQSVSGNYRNSAGAGTTESHNLWSDPQFVNASTRDFQLRSGSPARDHGMSLASVTRDIIGTPRPQWSAYDIGAFEMK